MSVRQMPGEAGTACVYQQGHDCGVSHLGRVPWTEPFPQSLWLSDLSIPVTGLGAYSDVFAGKTSHSGRCLQVKSELNPPPLETKPSSEGHGGVTDVLPTPGRCLGTWGLQYSYHSGNKYGAVPAKSTKRRETVPRRSDSESEEDVVGRGRGSRAQELPREAHKEGAWTF